MHNTSRTVRALVIVVALAMLSVHTGAPVDVLAAAFASVLAALHTSARPPRS